ncbi:MAG: universal stress protein [Acidobacteria bacterium]|nr:MAG: universal stress protein [Acidobacteriota bacterium]REK04174.1 MAG: universal stress protein [Acidobacteriota bacterium]REK15336.1 MAG: universal stress protein [Acidobacteriota bacterium]REK46426.1 MAG: universal stress protein [Acidobacteriota bacterium]
MNILLPTDGSDFSIAAARKCSDIAAKEESAIVRVVSIVETLTPDEPFDTESDYYQAVVQASKAAAEERVQIARTLILKDERNSGLTVETKTMSGKPDKLIIKECEDWPADLVVLGSHGYGFWSRTLLGSVSDSVVHHAPCSVLIVRKPRD